MPFGAQACEFKIGSWQYDESDIDVKVYKASFEDFWNPHVSKISIVGIPFLKKRIATFYKK